MTPVEPVKCLAAGGPRPETERSSVMTDRRAAVRGTRTAPRRLATEFGVEGLARAGRWLPYSRSPYGSGRRPGHWYHTEFR